MAQLEIKFLAGAETKAALMQLENLVKRLEKVASAPATEEVEDSEQAAEAEFGDTEPETEAEETETETEAETESFDAAEEEEKEEPAKAAKTTKAKKLTIDDANDAAKAAVTRVLTKRGVTGKEARNVVLACLKKNFKTETLSKIDAASFPQVVKVLSALK